MLAASGALRGVKTTQKQHEPQPPIAPAPLKCSDEVSASPAAQRARVAAVGHLQRSPNRALTPTKAIHAAASPAGDPAVKLPPSLELLASMFGGCEVACRPGVSAQQLQGAPLPLCADALQAGRQMLKRRGEKTTYAALKRVVENVTKRDFRVRVKRPGRLARSRQRGRTAHADLHTRTSRSVALAPTVD
jgi:hypothetical protein